MELDELAEEPLSPAAGASVVMVFMELEELAEEPCSPAEGASAVEFVELVEERFSSVVCAIRRGDSD